MDTNIGVHNVLELEKKYGSNEMGSLALKRCNELDEKNHKLANESLKLKNSVMELFEALKYMHEQHKCGCGNSACNRCDDDKDNEELLSKTWV